MPCFPPINSLNRQCTGCIHPLVYLVSTGMHVDGSIQNNVSLDIVLDDASSGEFCPLSRYNFVSSPLLQVDKPKTL